MAALKKYDFGSDGEIPMCIYKIEHKTSGKIYIGKTTGKAKDRWRVHLSPTCSIKTYIGSALKKYGIGQFEFSVIDCAENDVSLNHKEIFWIRYYKSAAPLGYNLTAGGDGARQTLETRQKRSMSMTGKSPTAKLVTRNDGEVFHSLTSAARACGVTRGCVARQLSGRSHTTNGFQFKYGTHDKWEIEFVDTSNSKAVVRSDGVEFPSVLAASIATGCTASAVSAVAKGVNRAVYGFSFKYK